MRADTKFYIFRKSEIPVVGGYSFDLTTGERITRSLAEGCASGYIGVNGARKITLDIDFPQSRVTIVMWNSNDEYRGYDVIYQEGMVDTYKVDYDLPQGVYMVGFKIDDSDFSGVKNLNESHGYQIQPHYKQLKKKYQRENGEMFFRESLEGKLNLFGTDYEIVKNASLEETLYFIVKKDDSVFASATFNRSDCKMNNAKKSVELKLSYDDKYTKILDAYENTYDLIKLAPAMSSLKLTKRCVLQIYVQGESVISSYAGGTYWEDEVSEPVDSDLALRNAYFFSKGPRLTELTLGRYVHAAGKSMAVNPKDTSSSLTCHYTVSDPRGYSGDVEDAYTLKFVKVANVGELVIDPNIPVFLLSTGSGNATVEEEGRVHYKYDTYAIELWCTRNQLGEGGRIFTEKLYSSVYTYGKDTSDFVLTQNGNYTLWAESGSEIVEHDILQSSINLGNIIIEYQIWGRLLCDVEESSDGYETHELSREDFAISRNNYKRVIGLRGFDEPDSPVKIYHTSDVSTEPTQYGTTDGLYYFRPPVTTRNQYFHPVSRKAWANTSMWLTFEDSLYPSNGWEVFCEKYYKEYKLRDSYHLSDVIKALLAKIDPSVTHERTAEYSTFLYEHLAENTDGAAAPLGNCDIYITQKTNILKSEYDQAAQKAEIKFKQLMEMLRDCYKCYWFIDEQNRFRIEHISYFMKGMSYSHYEPNIQLDLTSRTDKFNRKPALYYQEETEFDKSDLASRFEYAWMDDCTKAMGQGLTLDIKNGYVQKDKTEETNIDGFSSDIDFMLFNPDEFSKDGFVLLMADANGKVPIVRYYVLEEGQYDRLNTVFVQNWYASFNQLIRHHTYDLPGNRIDCNNIKNNAPDLSVHGIKRCVKHNVSFSVGNVSLNTNELIKTDMGNGYIEEVSINVDTYMADVELRYEPR